MQPWAVPPLVEPPPGTIIIHQDGLCIDPDYVTREGVKQSDVTALNIMYAQTSGHTYALGVFSDDEARSYGISVPQTHIEK